MNISLSRPMQDFVESKVREGEYASPEQVIEAALATLQQQQQGQFARGELDRLLAEGEADIENGRMYDGEETFRELDAMSAARRGERGK
jgi:putative addiction module CopG family antidote